MRRQTHSGPEHQLPLTEAVMSELQSTEFSVEELANEQWRQIPEHDGYDASTLGRIRSWWHTHGWVGQKSKIMSFWTNKKGYRVVTLKRGPTQIQPLILAAFVGPRPEGLQARHLDGNPGNNRLSNLKYGTAKENGEDKVRHGTSRQGTHHEYAAFTEEQVVEIRRLYRETGMDGNAIAEMFGSHGATILDVVTGRTYKNIPGHIEIPLGKTSMRGLKSQGEKSITARFTNSDVLDMRRRYSEGETIKDIGLIYDANRSTIFKIVNRQRWKHI
jgi:hypothetical protein